jgi:hypothetical protein
MCVCSQAEAATVPGGLVLTQAFPGAAALADARGVTLAGSGLGRREKLIVKAA